MLGLQTKIAELVSVPASFMPSGTHGAIAGEVLAF